jgi:hypothetical protein
MANAIQPTTAEDAIPLTKSDTTVFAKCAALYVGTGGAVTIKTGSGNNRTIPTVPSGAILPVSATMLLSTGTDASGVIALYY